MSGSQIVALVAWVLAMAWCWWENSQHDAGDFFNQAPWVAIFATFCAFAIIVGEWVA